VVSVHCYYNKGTHTEMRGLYINTLYRASKLITMYNAFVYKWHVICWVGSLRFKIKILGWLSEFYFRPYIYFTSKGSYKLYRFKLFSAQFLGLMSKQMQLYGSRSTLLTFENLKMYVLKLYRFVSETRGLCHTCTVESQYNREELLMSYAFW